MRRSFPIVLLVDLRELAPLSRQVIECEDRGDRANGHAGATIDALLGIDVQLWRISNRVMIAHEDTLTAGFGAEVAARIAENCIGSLDGPVVRVAAKDTFVPSAPNLELAVLPSIAGLRLGAEKALAF